ncbi:MAG: peptidylprolyl isomerase [Pseudomonadota bacterium]
MKTSLFRLFAILVFALSGAAHAGESLDRIIVVLNDGVILQSELDQSILDAKQQIKERGIADPPEDVLRTQVLERLILTKLQTQRAAEAGERIDDRELNEVITNIASQNGMTLPQFAESVKKDGNDYLAVREQIREQVLISRLRQKEVDGRISITDQDVDLFLATQPAGQEENKEYRLSHILIAVPDAAKNEERTKARAKAEDLVKRLKAGEDFAQLALANSNGQNALQGGDLDWRKAADLPSLFAATAAKLGKGDVSGVLEAGSGYHIIKLVDERGGSGRQTVAETHAKHILLSPNALRDEEQTRALSRDIYDRLQKGEDFTELAKKYSDDPGSKNSGGDLGFQAAGIFVPEFQVRLDQLKPGEISQPFHSKFGWHIASVIERRTRDTTEETRRNRARSAIGQRKSAEEYDNWLRKLREEAYVEYRLKSDADANAATKS